MDNSIIIKGNNHGITVILDPKMEYEKLKDALREKFTDSSKFLGSASVVLGFEGRALLPEQENELLSIINESCELNIVCLVDNDESREQKYEKALNDYLMDLSGSSGTFYKGNLRSGQAVNFETSVIVLGDVNPGASVTSKGNIIVLGSLKGQAFAGFGGNENAFVLALDMGPTQIRIADVIARSPDEPSKEEGKEIKIAFLEDGNIYMEPLNKKVWNDIRL